MKNGIYIHIPFCRNKCDYCSFYSIPVNDQSMVEAYIESLLNEINLISEKYGKVQADTVYLGGGTPSILKPSQAEKILNRLADRFILSSGSEITLEMNPDDLSAEKLNGFTIAGVNRIVLGVQSLDNDMRRKIGRRGRSVVKADLDMFFNHGGFTRCIDIMAGLPEQKEIQMLNDIEIITGYKPEHISLYLLSVDEDTPLGLRFSPDEKFDNLQADLWGSAIDFLEQEGYLHYEISNYALPGFESKHNSKYWDFTPYFGFGPGAHSYVDGRRYSNSMQVSDYIKSREFLYEVDTPGPDGIIVEFLMTSLRRLKGFSGEEFKAVTGLSLPGTVIKNLNVLESEGMVETGNGRYRLSKKGLYYTDSIIYRLSEQFLK
jgi:oxygen-independent coproporphyrinogen-3 oxidase